jgi:SAM-dependent methyltransferase
MADDARWLADMPEIYDRCLGPALFAPWAEHVAAQIAAQAPGSVLELAAGTGILTAELARWTTAPIIATDLNPAMVAYAARRVRGPTWQVADALALDADFGEAAFDTVVCQFGAMFFPDKARAFEQVARVLRPGGHFVFTVWDSVETSTFDGACTVSLRDLFPGDAPDFLARVPHGYHDAEQIGHDLAAGGLTLERFERVVLHGTAASAGVLAEGFCYGTPLRFALADRGDLNTLATQVAQGMAQRLGDGAVDGELAGYLVQATHPTAQPNAG